MSDTPGRRTAVLHSQDAGIPAAPGVVSSVYAVGAERLASVKIGTSASPQQRVSQLQTGLPVTLSILAVFPGGTRLERALHEYFSAYRTRGEWFDFTPLGDPVEVVRSAVEAFGPMPNGASPARGRPGRGPPGKPGGPCAPDLGWDNPVCYSEPRRASMTMGGIGLPSASLRSTWSSTAAAAS
ncbi:GIY-YIG nuclease family protein [Streptomyces uncialis]|uniref:GIY-YIG nuclease family protein n=1 Tax=Streptomyces uncialis TaxID=1048205 RepID=UPI0037876F1B